MQAKKIPRDVPVRYVKGVGPVNADLFARLGVENVSDLFYYLPRRYEDRSRVVSIKDIAPGDAQAVTGKVIKKSVFTARTGTRIFELVLGDGSARVFAVWYNQPFLSKVFSPGQEIVLYGKVDLDKRLQMTHPAYEIISGSKDAAGSLEIGRIVPFYSLTENISQRYIRKVVYRAVGTYAPAASDILPTGIRARRKLVDSRFAIENIHFPHSFDNLEKAYRRLVFEEFFILQTVMALRRKKTREGGISHCLHEGLVEDLERLFSFDLTSGQKKCIKEIELDMAEPKAMYRLLQGDVGSGKTAVAMSALLLTCRNGHQGAFMAPTEILARQHYVTVSKTLMPLGLNVRLLVSGMDEEGRDKVKREISSGDADIVIGTHALIQSDVAFSDLGLVIIDEQHKFGVEQRKALSKKGSMPDILVMTATPIPRSLVLTFFGDMDVSSLREKPGGRKEVTTYWAGEDKRHEIYDFISEEVKKGRQAFIVYPRIKKTGSLDLRSIEEMYEGLRKHVFRGLRLAMVHGQMRPADKDRVMDDFRSGEYDILVATTVIEVGVDIPNVSVMLVEHAERYGLAQLHQLRGRIGRGKHSSYCILLGDPTTESSAERLETMSETDDGFAIAEKDLDIRGPGEFLGTRQSGLPELKVGNIARDFGIMEEAREEALALVEEDPSLSDPRNSGLKAGILERFRGKLTV
jgi:ATP-dependent DNA helicase RecG